MPESKDCQIMVNVEYTIYDLLQKVRAKENKSASSYCRELIIKDLRNKGLLTEEIMALILTG